MTRVTCGSRVLLFISAWALCGAGPAASQPLSFHATLEPIKVDGRPQQVITRQFKLTLDPNQPETRFKAKVEDWWRSEDGTQSFYAEAGTLRHSCSRWVSLNPVESSIKAGETLTIRITITVPSEMAAGGYWCALTVDEIPDPRSLQSGVGVKFVASVSTGIFVNLGAVHRAARILDLQLTSDAATVTLQNEGDAPVGVDGRLEFYAPGANQPTASVVIPRRTLLTEPSLNGTLTARLPPAAELPDGRYRMRAILDYGATHYLGAEREVEVVRASPQIPPH